MKKLLYFLMLVTTAVLVSSCSQIKAGKIIDGVDTFMDVASKVCSVSSVFKDSVPPEASKCEDYLSKAIEIRQDDRVLAFVKVADCVEKHQKDFKALGQCIDAVDGWKIVVEELK